MKLAIIDTIRQIVSMLYRTGHHQQLIVIKSDVPVISAILISFIS